VTRIQDAFLEAPALRLTLVETGRRFGADDIACRAVLQALVEAEVLTRTSEGAYVRHFPRPIGFAA
jgi:hypothetical protein